MCEWSVHNRRSDRSIDTMASPSSLYTMIPIPEAQRIVLDNTPVLPPETVTLPQALGRTLAVPVQAPDSLPPFPASIKVRQAHQPMLHMMDLYLMIC